MSLEHILLGMLREKPSSGFELKAEFDQSARLFWNAELSQIYPTLKRLEKRGELESELGDSIRGPKRRVYHVTPKGAEALREWLRSEPEAENSRFPYIAQVYFLHELEDLEETMRQVTRLRDLWAGRLENLERIDATIQQECGPLERQRPADFHSYLALRAGAHQLRGKLAWCEEALDLLETKRAAERRASGT